MYDTGNANYDSKCTKFKNPYMWKKVTKYRVCMGVERNKVL